MNGVRNLQAAAALALLCQATFAAARTDIEMHEAAAVLRPGEFVWNEDATTANPPSLVVSIALQRVYVYRGDILAGVASVSTGSRGHATPQGDFTVLQKARWHRSNLYSNAPMPFMQRLTWGGIALHAGHNPGFPASHGCVRLPSSFARDLFDQVPIGADVTIADYPLRFPVVLPTFGVAPEEPAPRLDYRFDAIG